jgi:hypothetical protein
MEQGWLYMAMAKAMVNATESLRNAYGSLTAAFQALDLGLNRSTEDWKVGGKHILSANDMESRKRIWWACCITDK